jgi:hypothetical protein
MKAKVWVLCTVLTDENAPAMPAVFADAAAARAAYDKACAPSGTAAWTGPTMVPYSGDRDAVQDRMEPPPFASFATIGMFGAQEKAPPQRG